MSKACSSHCFYWREIRNDILPNPSAIIDTTDTIIDEWSQTSAIIRQWSYQSFQWSQTDSVKYRFSYYKRTANFLRYLRIMWQALIIKITFHTLQLNLFTYIFAVYTVMPYTFTSWRHTWKLLCCDFESCMPPVSECVDRWRVVQCCDKRLALAGAVAKYRNEVKWHQHHSEKMSKLKINLTNRKAYVLMYGVNLHRLTRLSYKCYCYYQL